MTAEAPKVEGKRFLLVLRTRDIGRIRVSKHVEAQFHHADFTQGRTTVMLGFKRALPGPDTKRGRFLRSIGEVQPVHITADQLHELEHTEKAVFRVQLGDTIHHLDIMTDKTWRLFQHEQRLAKEKEGKLLDMGPPPPDFLEGLDQVLKEVAEKAKEEPKP